MFDDAADDCEPQIVEPFEEINLGTPSLLLSLHHMGSSQQELNIKSSGRSIQGATGQAASRAVLSYTSTMGATHTLVFYDVC